MPITKAFAFLIPPGKGSGSVPAISSKEIVIGTNKLSVMLSDIFADNPGPHDFEITFSPAPDGQKLMNAVIWCWHSMQARLQQQA